MKRREFNHTLVGGAVAAGINVSSASGADAKNASGPRKNTLMHVGADYHSVAGGPRADMTGKANLEYNLRHGVRHLTAQMRTVSSDGSCRLDERKTMDGNGDEEGVIVDDIRLDFG